MTHDVHAASSTGTLEFFRRTFDSSSFAPHGHCYRWDPAVVWLHVISDAAIAFSYYSIPIGLVFFLSRRRDLAYKWMFAMFAAFILACGTTHLFNIITVWTPVYRLDGLVKVLTGGLSVATAITLWPLIPRAVALPSPGQIRQTNALLQQQIAERQAAEAALRETYAGLERTIQERTAELVAANAALQSEIADRRAAEESLLESNRRINEVLERINDPFLAVDANWRVTYMNSHALELGHLRAKEVIGRVLWEAIPELVGSPVEQYYRAAMREQRVMTFEGRGVRSGRWQASTIYPSPDGLAVFGRDITERREAEARRREDEARKTAMLESALDCIVTMDAEGRIVDFNAAAERTFGHARQEVAGRTVAEVLIPARFRESHTRGLEEFRRSGRGPVIGRRIELTAQRRDGSEFPVELAITHTRLESGAPFFTAYLRDITERRLAEERQRLLAAELDHRVKNILATVLAIAEQTARASGSLQEFGPAFTGRVASIARAHDRLAKTHWTGASLRDLVQQTLAHFADKEGRRVVVSGDPVTIQARAATGLSITLNELATNAAKYGALSVPEGRVEVTWEIGPQPELQGANGVGLTWSEHGGPPVRPPTRRGFGTALITGTIPYELRGKVEIRYDESGVRCRMAWPADESALPVPGAKGGS